MPNAETHMQRAGNTEPRMPKLICGMRETPNTEAHMRQAGNTECRTPRTVPRGCMTVMKVTRIEWTA